MRNDLKITLLFDLPIYGIDECPTSAFKVSYMTGGRFPREEVVGVQRLEAIGNSLIGTIPAVGFRTPLGYLPEVTDNAV